MPDSLRLDSLSMGARAENVHSIAPDLALEAIAERLRIAREHAGLSQGQFATKMGCGRRRVVAWENGENAPPVLVIARVREVCGVDPEWVLCGPGLIPLEDVTAEDRQRKSRVARRLVKLAKGYGIDLSAEAVEDFSRIVLREPAEREEDAIRLVTEVLRSRVRGMG